MSSCVRYTRDQNNLATLTLDMPGKSVNTLSRQMWTDLDAAISQAERDNPRGLLIVSAKPRTFIAGADLFELRAMTDEELDRYLAEGQRILNRLESLAFPTVAVVAGDALGGGLEVALACRRRVAADDPAVKLGLPEVQLGLCPGWGGTVRLTRLIGAEKALAIATSGKPLAPADALKAGIVDAIAPREKLLSVAEGLLAGESRSAPAEGGGALAAIDQSIADLEKRNTSANPAPARIARIIRATVEKGSQVGFDAERVGLVELRKTKAGQNLLRLFFLRQSAKKDAATAAGAAPGKIETVGVIGGGMMGGGIVHVLVKAGFKVVCVEAEAVAPTAAARIKAALEKEGLSADRHEVTSEMEKVGGCDLIIEAISESLPAKEELFKKLDSIAKVSAILATNTSSLSVAKLANAVNDASRVVGLHFFNPVPKMPLVEIVRQPCSSPFAVATAVALATQLGKTPIVCNDAPGFIVNRVLMPYLSESMRLAEDGVAIERIDAAVRRWGMPMGPFELLDQIGLDVMAGIFAALEPHLGERVRVGPLMCAALEAKSLGRKTKRGFYVYPDDRAAKPQVNPSVAAGFAKPDMKPEDEAIQDRCLLPMANEAARVLEEKVTESVDAIDLATITGLGMAGWRGGIVRYVLDTGVSIIASKLQALAAAHGDRLNPSDYLWKMAEAAR